MPVYKYKTFEEAEKALWNFEPDEAYFERVRQLFALAQQLNPVRCPRGVFKFKTIEEANKHRDESILSHCLEKMGLTPRDP